MQKTPILAAGPLLFSAIFAQQGFAQPATAPTSSAVDASSSSATNIVAAANTFLATLDDVQCGRVVYEFKDDVQRRRWSNLPVGSYPRGGLRMGNLTGPQREATMAMLAAVLSPQGYEKVMQIMEGDEYLKVSGRGRPDFGFDDYYVSILGQPSITEPWMLQFGGHHLALNVTFVGDQGVLTPSHTAAQPASFEWEGKTVRPLGRENDKAFALVQALDETQRGQAILGSQMRDLVLGPGRDGQTIQPEGIRGSELTEQQQAMLLDLAGEWTGIIHEAAAAAKLAELKENIGETWFAWSGPTENGSAAYFRIQGPTVVIEYAPQGRGGRATDHIHTIYRDPTNDYGRALTSQ